MFDRLPACHSFINKKIGMSSVLGPNKLISEDEADLFFDTLTALRTMKLGLTATNLTFQNLNDNTLLTVSPLVVDYEYFNPTTVYTELFKNHLAVFPKDSRKAVREIINLAATAHSQPMHKVRFQYVRVFADQLFTLYKNMPRKIRVHNVSQFCQVVVFGNRFMFITFGDVGNLREPQGHMDLFGIDLHGVVEAYINGCDLHSSGFKLPTLMSFRNVPTMSCRTGCVKKIEELDKPVKHTWVEVLGKNTTTHEIIAVDFNSIAQNYVNNPRTALTDARWETIKQMIKFEGEHSVNSRVKAGTSRVKFKQAS